MPFLSANWIIGFACAWLFFAMGRHEARNGDAPDHGMWWALASIVVTVLAMLWAGWVGRERPEPDREVLLQRLGEGLSRETPLRYAAPRPGSPSSHPPSWRG